MQLVFVPLEWVMPHFYWTLAIALAFAIIPALVVYVAYYVKLKSFKLLSFAMIIATGLSTTFIFLYRSYGGFINAELGQSEIQLNYPKPFAKALTLRFSDIETVVAAEVTNRRAIKVYLGCNVRIRTKSGDTYVSANADRVLSFCTDARDQIARIPIK